MRAVDAPTAPGVYYLLTKTGRLSYVGKAANLRRRLGDHTRDARWERITDVRWEALPSETAAIAREADVMQQARGVEELPVDVDAPDGAEGSTEGVRALGVVEEGGRESIGRVGPSDAGEDGSRRTELDQVEVSPTARTLGVEETVTAAR